MRCPNCGAEVESDDAPFCPHCGHNLAGRRGRRKLRFILLDVQEDKRFRHLASAAVIAIVVAAVLSVMLVQWDDGSGDPQMPEAAPLPESALAVSDTDYIELSGDFLGGGLSASITEEGELRMDLDPELAEGMESFTWILRDATDSTYQYLTKDASEPGCSTLHWMSPGIGRYTVIVVCQPSDGGEAEVHTGGMVYMGHLNELHSFTYGGEQYTVRIDIPLEEYLGYRDADGPRDSDSATDAASFVVTGQALHRLNVSLSDQYLIHGGDRGDRRDYAGYVLAFVRSYVTPSTDTVLHGCSEYWAYPVETLYTGAGDEGDMSVLTAALLRQDGYTTGIAVIHGHTLAAVHLDRFTDPADIPGGYHVVRITVGQVPYYLCEMTADVPLGCVDDAYDYDRGTYTYYGQNASSSSGFGLPPAEP